MAHLSENVKELQKVVLDEPICEFDCTDPNVESILLPYYPTLESVPDKTKLYSDLVSFIDKCNNESTIAILSSPVVAADFCTSLTNAQIKLWISIKLENPINSEYRASLSQSHAALLILVKYHGSLKHTKTRIGYSYCPTCNKTTKDYGGKKHLYHQFGTVISDVWRDLTIDVNTYPKLVIDRISDLFGLQSYSKVNVHDQTRYYASLDKISQKFKNCSAVESSEEIESRLLNGDSLIELRKLPDNSIDFCFADPPYNLNKSYETWDDGIDLKEYFLWCDSWLTELARVLKPGRTLAVLNIPQWAIRHFKHLLSLLDYQDWIVWEGLSMPVRMIMPSNYSTICFSKGEPRRLPGLNREINSDLEKYSLHTTKENYCSRPPCIKTRKSLGITDSELISNLWWDVHRLKHNSRRVDHPCQLPPLFMQRLIALFTNENEIVLDPFNGVGTTSLTAKQLNRRYLGIELSHYYHNIASKRHDELEIGLDPFRKNNDSGPKAKNSPVERLKKQKYLVSKKTLQLEIKRIAKELGRIPTREEVARHTAYPITFYDNYFINWGEATAAARTTGMTETRDLVLVTQDTTANQLPLF